MTAYLIKLMLVLFVLSVLTMQPIFWMLEASVIALTIALSLRGFLLGK